MLAEMLAAQEQLRRRKFFRGNALWWAALAAGLLLRLWFLWHPMGLDPDTDMYAQLGKNLLHHGIYGLQPDAVIYPSIIRLPGYPLFLGSMFAIFGADNFRAVFAAQIGIDLFGCWLIASFVREQVSEKAGTIAIFLAALCPFTAAYTSIALTECLSVFAVSLALWSTGRVLQAQAAGRRDRTAMLCAAVAMALAVLLRPDGALVGIAVMSAIVWYAWRQGSTLAGLKTAMLCSLLTVVSLTPWAVRNWRTFHVIQPLAPRRVNEVWEHVNYGFYRWINTWSVDYVSTGNVFWQVDTEEIHIDDLPTRAYDSPQQRAQTAEILAEYNAKKPLTGCPMSLRKLTRSLPRWRSSVCGSIRCCAWCGCRVCGVADMFLRPRTETLGLDADWWRFNQHYVESAEAVALGLLNLALIVAALWGVVRGRIPWVAMAVAYVLLRCVLLSTMENSEPRYTLEAMPIVIACAACALGGRRALNAVPTARPVDALSA